jgi:hypothetical protein
VIHRQVVADARREQHEQRAREDTPRGLFHPARRT